MFNQEQRQSSGALAYSIYIANLLFTGLGLVVLIAYSVRKSQGIKNLSNIHIKQSLLASILTTLVFIVINLYIIFFTPGHLSLTGLVILEVYYMFIVPICVIPGIVGLTRAINGKDYTFPMIGRHL